MGTPRILKAPNWASVLVRVVQEQPDLAVGPQPGRREGRRHPGGTVVVLPPAPADAPVDDGGSVGQDVGDRFPRWRSASPSAGMIAQCPSRTPIRSNMGRTARGLGHPAGHPRRRRATVGFEPAEFAVDPGVRWRPRRRPRAGGAPPAVRCWTWEAVAVGARSCWRLRPGSSTPSTRAPMLDLIERTAGPRHHGRDPPRTVARHRRRGSASGPRRLPPRGLQRPDIVPFLVALTSNATGRRRRAHLVSSHDRVARRLAPVLGSRPPAGADRRVRRRSCGGSAGRLSVATAAVARRPPVPRPGAGRALDPPTVVPPRGAHGRGEYLRHHPLRWPSEVVTVRWPGAGATDTVPCPWGCGRPWGWARAASCCRRSRFWPCERRGDGASGRKSGGPARRDARADARAPDELVAVQVQLRLRDQAGMNAGTLGVDSRQPDYRRYLSGDEFEARFAPTDATVAEVSAWLTSQGLTVTSVPTNHFYVAAEGTAAQVEAAFAIGLATVEANGGQRRVNTAEPAVPRNWPPSWMASPGSPRCSPTRPASAGRTRPGRRSRRRGRPAPGARTAGPCSKWWGEDGAAGLPLRQRLPGPARLGTLRVDAARASRARRGRSGRQRHRRLGRSGRRRRCVPVAHAPWRCLELRPSERSRAPAPQAATRRTGAAA